MVDDRPLALAADGSQRVASRLLAIECATRSASVALLLDGALAGERICHDRGNHAETLLGLLDDLLGDTRVSLEEIDGFAVSIGPGSFTSLRVGLATVKGLAFGSDAPVAPISTLAALAWQAGGAAKSDVAAALDARRGELYGAVFRCGGGADESPGSSGSGFSPSAPMASADHIATARTGKNRSGPRPSAPSRTGARCRWSRGCSACAR